MSINKTSDRIAKLAHDLGSQGFIDEAIDVATLSSGFTDALDQFLPVTKSVMAGALFERDKTLYRVRESLLSAFYERHFKTYETFLSKPK